MTLPATGAIGPLVPADLVATREQDRWRSAVAC